VTLREEREIGRKRLKMIMIQIKKKQLQKN
jgi:hypothetical protein